MYALYCLYSTVQRKKKNYKVKHIVELKKVLKRERGNNGIRKIRHQKCHSLQET